MSNLRLLVEDLAAIQNRWYELSRDHGRFTDENWLGDIAYGVEIALSTVKVFLEVKDLDSHAACDALRQLDGQWQSLVEKPASRRDKRNAECVRDGIRIILRRFNSHGKRKSIRTMIEDPTDEQ